MRTVLFMSMRNTGRSLMCEALFNRRARELSLPLRAISAGAMTAASVDPAAMEALRELGVDVSGLAPKRVTQEMADGADMIISVGCGDMGAHCPSDLPARFEVNEDWNLDVLQDGSADGARELAGQIEERVGLLVARMSSEIAGSARA